jgi:hypothetical protein
MLKIRSKNIILSEILSVCKILLFFGFIMFPSCQNNEPNAEKKDDISQEEILLSEQYNWKEFDDLNYFGEVLFLPIYSSIYHQKDKIFDLSATLTIHNTDINESVIVSKIDYYNTDGKLVRRFLSYADTIRSLQSKQFIIHESDRSGGTAAKFVVQWYSKVRVVKPLIESVMISTSSQQGISFKADHRVISTIGY